MAPLVASLADPLNGRSPRHITLPFSELALPLQRERNRSQQAMIAWPHILPSTRNKMLRCERWRSER
jgi:hypothetical protein